MGHRSVIGSNQTEWDENLNLLSLKIDFKEVDDIRGHEKLIADHKKKAKIKLAKELKELEYKKDNTKKVIGYRYHHNHIQRYEVTPKQKMLEDSRVSSWTLFEDTEENIILAKKYNKKLDEINKIEKEMHELKKKMTEYKHIE